MHFRFRGTLGGWVGCQGILDTVAERFEIWDEDINRIVQAEAELKVSHLKLRRQVAKARQAGHSWASIGLALRITRQAAQQRFGTIEADGQ